MSHEAVHFVITKKKKKVSKPVGMQAEFGHGEGPAHIPKRSVSHILTVTQTPKNQEFLNEQ